MTRSARDGGRRARPQASARGPARNANLATALPRRRGAPPMQVYDRLPPELRAWLREAVLPWSPRSALRLWRRALSETGDPAAARARLDAAEARQLARDAMGARPPMPAGRPSA